MWDALTTAERQAVQTTQGMMQMVGHGMVNAEELPGMLQRAGYDGDGVRQMMGLYEHADAVTPGLGKTPFNAALVRPGDVAELELSEEASAELKVRVREQVALAYCWFGGGFERLRVQHHSPTGRSFLNEGSGSTFTLRD